MTNRWMYSVLFCIMAFHGLSQHTNIPVDSAASLFRKELMTLKSLKGIEGATVSWCFRDFNTGNLIEAQNEQLLMVPASTAKIYTSVAALEVLGVDFRYATRLYLHGRAMHWGRFHGDIVVQGSGDPSLGHRDKRVIHNFLTAITSSGIERIRGGAEVDPFIFPYDYRTFPRDRAWEDIANYYGTGIYGINWMNNSLPVRFIAGKDSVKMEAELPVEITGKISVGPTEEISFFPLPSSSEIQVSGGLPPNAKPITERMALPDPPLQFIRSLHDSLEQAGIKIRDAYQVRKETFTPEADDSLLAVFYSDELRELLHEVNRKSNNLYAEAIARTTGSKLKANGSAEDACAKIKTYLIKNKLTVDTLFSLREGSGLSRKNLVTTAGMTDLLQRAGNKSWFPAFEASLAQPGNDGTLKTFKPINGLRAKTGSMAGVRSYAGYFMDASGKRIVFSIIINNYLDGSVIRGKIEQILEKASSCRF